jgi:hypothetical protein
VDAQCYERLVVDLHWHAWAADGSGDGQVGALPQQTGLKQRDDLAVDRRNAERCDPGDDVTADWATQPDGPENRRRR